MVATLEDIGAMRTKNDQDFVVVEEWQFYKSFLHFYITRTGQKNTPLWQWIFSHYNSYKLACGEESLVRSLETIYGLIKHVITKFAQILNFVVVLNESGTFLEDVLHKALYLSKLKHPKKILSYLSILGWS
jgi:hypothetical protein